MSRFASELRATGEIRSDLSDQQVADLVWSMNSAEYFGLLASRGLTPQEYSDVLADVWRRTLLAASVPASEQGALARRRNAD
jgi:hypothetical protein